MAGTKGESPRRRNGGGSPCEDLRGLGALQVLTNVLENLAHDWAQEDEGDDHDNRDQGQEQSVLDERLAFLILAAETSQKIADEQLKHSFAIPPFLGDLPAQRMRGLASSK